MAKTSQALIDQASEGIPEFRSVGGLFVSYTLVNTASAYTGVEQRVRKTWTAKTGIGGF